MHLGWIVNLDMVLGEVFKTAGRSHVHGWSICLVRVWCLTLSVEGWGGGDSAAPTLSVNINLTIIAQ